MAGSGIRCHRKIQIRVIEKIYVPIDKISQQFSMATKSIFN